MSNRRSIFLSYRRQETSHLAGRLADRLFSEFGEAHVFVDVDSIAPGRDFGEAIESALNECAVLLALIGPAWTSAVDTHGRRRLVRQPQGVMFEALSLVVAAFGAGLVESAPG